jgi:hypothetical protein
MCKGGNRVPAVMPAKAGIQQGMRGKFEENDMGGVGTVAPWPTNDRLPLKPHAQSSSLRDATVGRQLGL